MHYHEDNDSVQSVWVSLSKRFHSLQDLSMGDEWNGIKESINKTCEEVLRNSTGEHKE